MSNEDKKLVQPIIFNDENTSKQDENAKLIRPIIFDAPTKDVEEKTYIILYNIDPEDDMDEIYSRIFSVCIGRTDAYFDIKEKLTSGLGVNIYTSKVITETKQTETESGDTKYYLLPYDECVNIYAFCTGIQSFYGEDGFDINDYVNNGSPDDKDDMENNTFFLTPEQKAYRAMIDEAMNMRRSTNNPQSNDNPTV